MHDMHRPAWRVMSTLQMTIVLALVIAAVGIVTSRVDVLLVALPLVLSAAVANDRRPTAAADSVLRVDVSRSDAAPHGSAFAYHVAVCAPARTEFVHLRVRPQGAPVHELILAGAPATLSGSVPIMQTGRQAIVTVTYRLIGAECAWLSQPSPVVVTERVVSPVIAALASVPLPHRLRGLTGSHPSARPGDGGEFRDLHRYAPGDRLRRIDWKATARRSQGFGDLYVRRTDALSDATVVLVMDSRDDIGERVAHWPDAPGYRDGVSSMDLAREAAASLAVAAVGMGDRVSLVDLAALNGCVSAGSGKRHLDRLLRRIASSAPSGPRLTRRRAPVVPAGAMVYLLSTFLDDDAAALAPLWRAAGHRVIAIDVLPGLGFEASASRVRVAHRLLLMGRRQRMDTLRRSGIEFIRWAEDGNTPHRAAALRTLARTGQRRR